VTYRGLDRRWTPDTLVLVCACSSVHLADRAGSTCPYSQCDLTECEPRTVASLGAANAARAAGSAGGVPPAAVADAVRSAAHDAYVAPAAGGVPEPCSWSGCVGAFDHVTSVLCPRCRRPAPPPLALVVGARREPLRDGDVLGREGTVAAELFAFPEVSRQHARVLRRDGTWWLEALSASNVTRLDGRDVARGTRVALGDHHAVLLSTRCAVGLEAAPRHLRSGPDGVT